MATTNDLGVFKALADVLEEMSLEELEHFCTATMKAATTGQLLFQARFPAEYEAWNAAVESGAISFEDGVD